MGKFLAFRLIWAVPTLLAIMVISFLLVHLAPGDPIQALVGDYPAPPDYVAAIRSRFGLDQPLSTQLWLYVLHVMRGDLGFSFVTRETVLGVIMERAPMTLLLMIPALIFSTIIGVVLALFSAPRAGSALDNGVTAFSLLGASVPVFWLGQILIIVFAIHLSWLPVQGMMSLRTPAEGFGKVLDILWHLVLPIFCLTLAYSAVIARVARASVIEALSHDFVLTARAKGMSSRVILWKHILPNASIPIVTVIGYNFGHCLTGAILTEAVFAWPGLGSAFIASIQNRDYPLTQGIFLFVTLVVIISNIATDAATATIDPRVRRSYRLNV